MRRGWSPSSFHLRGSSPPFSFLRDPPSPPLPLCSLLPCPTLPPVLISPSLSPCSYLSFHPRAIDVARLSNDCARSDNRDGACYVLVGRRKTGGGRTNERSNEREESCNDDEDDDEDEVTVTATSANTGAPDTNRSSPRHCFPTSSVNTHTHTHIYIHIHTRPAPTTRFVNSDSSCTLASVYRSKWVPRLHT